MNRSITSDIVTIDTVITSNNSNRDSHIDSDKKSNRYYYADRLEDSFDLYQIIEKEWDKALIDESEDVRFINIYEYNCSVNDINKSNKNSNERSKRYNSAKINDSNVSTEEVDDKYINYANNYYSKIVLGVCGAFIFVATVTYPFNNNNANQVETNNAELEESDTELTRRIVKLKDFVRCLSVSFEYDFTTLEATLWHDQSYSSEKSCSDLIEQYFDLIDNRNPKDKISGDKKRYLYKILFSEFNYGSQKLDYLLYKKLYRVLDHFDLPELNKFKPKSREDKKYEEEVDEEIIHINPDTYLNLHCSYAIILLYSGMLALVRISKISRNIIKHPLMQIEEERSYLIESNKMIIKDVDAEKDIGISQPYDSSMINMYFGSSEYTCIMDEVQLSEKYSKFAWEVLNDKQIKEKSEYIKFKSVLNKIRNSFSKQQNDD